MHHPPFPTLVRHFVPIVSIAISALSGVPWVVLAQDREAVPTLEQLERQLQEKKSEQKSAERQTDQSKINADSNSKRATKASHVDTADCAAAKLDCLNGSSICAKWPDRLNKERVVCSGINDFTSYTTTDCSTAQSNCRSGSSLCEKWVERFHKANFFCSGVSH
jgi:hypothetical protein